MGASTNLTLLHFLIFRVLRSECDDKDSACALAKEVQRDFAKISGGNSPLSGVRPAYAGAPIHCRAGLYYRKGCEPVDRELLVSTKLSLRAVWCPWYSEWLPVDDSKQHCAASQDYWL